ncbi:MAG TPA: glycosyl hydrolase family 18 protein [Terriglobales bacterium]|nr:glycosyl hydrolase family 18 protein [Terriglobales bacterium]
MTQRKVALWIGDGYFRDQAGSSNLVQLESDITNHHVSFLFTFFASIRENGTIDTDVGKDLAGPVIGQLHAYGVKVIAVMDGWGPDFPGTLRAGYALDLRQPQVRHAIAVSAAYLITFGFDGIQLDIEGVKCDLLQCQGPEYTQLVSEVRQRINVVINGFTPYLSVDLPPRTGSICEAANPWVRWADYAAIAQYVDAIIPMAYDSNFFYWLCASSVTYGGWVGAVADYALDSVQGTGAMVLVGVPSGRTFESLTDALHEISTLTSRSLQGVTVFMYSYASNELDQNEWNALDSFLIS